MRHWQTPSLSRLVLLAISLVLAGALYRTPKVAAQRSEPATAPSSITVIGKLTATTVDIRTPIDGTVEQICFQEGQPVKQGDLLARLDDRKQRAALEQAIALLKVSEAKLEKARQQREAEPASAGDLEQATAEVAAAQAVVAARKLDLMDTRLVAPFNGTMDECIVAPGQVLSKGAAISTLVQLDPLKVQCAVSEDVAMRVRLGAKILFAPAAKPATTVDAVIDFVSPQIVGQTQRVAARVANHDHQLRPGMTVTVTISLTK